MRQRAAAAILILLVLALVIRTWLGTRHAIFAFIMLVEAGTIAAILWATVPMVARRLRPHGRSN